MKHALAAAALMAVLAAPAFADNADVDQALAGRPELSEFTQALERTGVLQSLDPDRSYTVFAPTNAAMAKITREKYPCFYMAQCRDETARILENHIVPGRMRIAEASAQRGGFYPLSNRFVPIGEMGMNRYAVDGHYILESFQAGGGNAPSYAKIYEISGLIANPYERTVLEHADAYQPQEQVTTSSTTIPDPACRDNSCSDSSTRTITYTRSVIVH